MMKEKDGKEVGDGGDDIGKRKGRDKRKRERERNKRRTSRVK